MKKIAISLVVISLLGIGTIALAHNSYNYHHQEHEDTSSCDTQTPPVVPTPVLGCTDGTATNYNPLATQDDGSCTYPPVIPPVPTPVIGCTDNIATNYNPLATQSDGSCIYPSSNDNNPPVTPPGSNDNNPPVNPPGGSDDTTPPVTPPSGGSNDTTPPAPPVTPGGGGESTPPPVVSGGGYGGHPPILPTVQSGQSTQIALNPAPKSTQCTPITNLVVDTGVVGDGKVSLSWTGGSDEKFITYGTDKNNLDGFQTTTDNQIELSGLKLVNYWFGVSNGCSSTPLIDPIP